ncbi:MAG: LysM peptidoglycan-binding domain-containing protein [Candidatus Saccharibacteria bacterium]|nr:LysM peptidoglycan-binding domain-containing protein [Candidatus Saccharibacteria bacterium]
MINNFLKNRHLRRVSSYIAVGIITLVLVFVGSIDKKGSTTSLSLKAFAESNYRVSIDQLSELYVVADLSDSLGLASAEDTASNYVIATSMLDSGQIPTGRLQKPVLPITSIQREGVIKHSVSEGESMDSIAESFGVSTDQIRWSNGLKTKDIKAGDTLYIPSSSGIVYTIKSGDTISSIVSKYGGREEEIIHYNDLENSDISEGMRIFIKNGSLPEKERPEYVPPASTRTYTYTYLGDTSERQNITVVGFFYGLGGPYMAGQCTQWAWYKRKEIGREIPSTLGNANTWAIRAQNLGYLVNRTPEAGAVFQTSAGQYGHVGFVEAVNEDGSITITEMNYAYRNFRVVRAIIPANVVGNLYYIH